MKTRFNCSVFLLFIASLLFLYSCSEERNGIVRQSNQIIEKLGMSLNQLQSLRDSSVYGDQKGMYPLESKNILEGAITNVSTVIISIYNGSNKNPSDSEINGTITSANDSIGKFKSTIRTENLKYDAELFVDGNNGGYIDFGKSVNFSKFGDPGNQAFTVCLWVKLEQTSGFGCIVSTYEEDDSANPRYRKGWMINHFNNDFMRMSYGLNDYNLWEPGSGFKDTGVWLHVAAVYNDKGVDGEYNNGNPTIVKLYFNGNLVATVNNNNPSVYYNNAADLNASMTGFVQFDKNGNKNRAATGYIKDFYVWNSAKNQSEIQKIMNDENYVSGKESDLVCGWNFNKTVDDNQNIKDLTGRYTAKLIGTYKWIRK